MKFDLPLFDRIRVKPSEDRRFQADAPACDWQGCRNKATHRAPKGRLRENEYWRFCLDHVREYNHSYNYFAGMSDDAVSKLPEGRRHRPSPDLEDGHWQRRPAPARVRRRTARRDPFDVFREFGGASAAERRAVRAAARTVRNAERKAFDVLGLEVDADRADDQGALQGPGEAPPSGRQWRRPLARGQAARDHPGLQLPEVGRAC